MRLPPSFSPRPSTHTHTYASRLVSNPCSHCPAYMCISYLFILRLRTYFVVGRLTRPRRGSVPPACTARCIWGRPRGFPSVGDSWSRGAGAGEACVHGSGQRWHLPVFVRMTVGRRKGFCLLGSWFCVIYYLYPVYAHTIHVFA